MTKRDHLEQGAEWGLYARWISMDALPRHKAKLTLPKRCLIESVPCLGLRLICACASE